MTLLDKVRKQPFVAFVDDERSIGNSIIVTLAEGWCFRNDPGCGVRGFDSATDCFRRTTKSDVYKVETK